MKLNVDRSNVNWGYLDFTFQTDAEWRSSRLQMVIGMGMFGASAWSKIPGNERDILISVHPFYYVRGEVD